MDQGHRYWRWYSVNPPNTLLFSFCLLCSSLAASVYFRAVPHSSMLTYLTPTSLSTSASGGGFSPPFRASPLCFDLSNPSAYTQAPCSCKMCVKICSFFLTGFCCLGSHWVFVCLGTQGGHLSSTGQSFNVGMSVRGAVAKFNPVPDDRRRMSDEPIRPFPGSVADWAAGNGCVVRVCPVPLFFHQYPAVALDRSVDSVKVTHGSEIAKDAVRYMCVYIVSPLCVSFINILMENLLG